MIFEWNEKITFHAIFHSFFTKFWAKIWTVNVIFQLRHKNPLSFKIRTYKKVVIRGEKIYYSTSQLLRLKLILSILSKSMFLKNISLSHRLFFSNKTKFDVFAHSTCHRQDFCQTYNFHFPSGMCIEQRASAAFWWQILIMAVWWLCLHVSTGCIYFFQDL